MKENERNCASLKLYPLLFVYLIRRLKQGGLDHEQAFCNVDLVFIGKWLEQGGTMMNKFSMMLIWASLANGWNREAR